LTKIIHSALETSETCSLLTNWVHISDLVTRLKKKWVSCFPQVPLLSSGLMAVQNVILVVVLLSPIHETTSSMPTCGKSQTSQGYFITQTFFLVVLAVELRVLHLLDRHSPTIWATHPDLFCVDYFEDRFSLYTWAGMDFDNPICASLVAEMTGMHHHIQSLVEMGVSWTFMPRLAWNHDPPQGARITGLSHPCLVCDLQLNLLFSRVELKLYN
jgi:hypothetical protein